METFLSISMGIGLSAACGFRVFVPLCAASIATYTGHITPAEGFEWLGTWPAMIALGTATLLEIGTYYIPWLDNAVDSIATPAAIVAGSLVSASFLPEMSPLLRWTLATILGGGTAGLIQGATVLARGSSTAGSGGITNPLLSTAELGSSILATLLAIVIPIAAALIVLILFFFAGKRIKKQCFEENPKPLCDKTNAHQEAP